MFKNELSIVSVKPKLAYGDLGRSPDIPTNARYSIFQNIIIIAFFIVIIVIIVITVITVIIVFIVIFDIIIIITIMFIIIFQCYNLHLFCEKKTIF